MVRRMPRHELLHVGDEPIHGSADADQVLEIEEQRVGNRDEPTPTPARVPAKRQVAFEQAPLRRGVGQLLENPLAQLEDPRQAAGEIA